MMWEYAQLHVGSYERDGAWYSLAQWYPSDGSIDTLVPETLSENLSFDIVLAVNHYGALGWELVSLEVLLSPMATDPAHRSGGSGNSRRFWFKRALGASRHTADVDADGMIDIAWVLDQGGNLNGDRLAKASGLDFRVLTEARALAVSRRSAENGDWSDRYKAYSRIISAFDQAVAIAIDLT